MNKIQIPWEDRPVGCTDVMWRYSQNPVIGRYHIPSSNSIFNSAVVPFEDGFAGVFRCDNKAVQMNIFAGFSKDGIHWDINHEPIQFKAGNTEMIESEYKYDPRVTWIEDRYWVTWCNGYHGPTIGIAYTFDFKEFFQCENAFLPFNRNGVLFPQKSPCPRHHQRSVAVPWNYQRMYLSTACHTIWLYRLKDGHGPLNHAEYELLYCRSGIDCRYRSRCFYCLLYLALGKGSEIPGTF